MLSYSDQYNICNGQWSWKYSTKELIIFDTHFAEDTEWHCGFEQFDAVNVIEWV